ncbi:MAG: SH3 domain-containing protein [Lachnospiraceae bacterium]|nr:SH3 domain-containing protein [Lachnospiraceae bacterium]
MQNKRSRNMTQLMIALVVLILILVIVIVSLLAGGRVWKEQDESESSVGQTVMAGGDREDFTEESTSGRVSVSEGDGDPMSQDKTLPDEGVGAEVKLESGSGDTHSQEGDGAGQTEGEGSGQTHPETPTVRPVTTLGIDVSKWQGKIDWQQVADAGVDFAIVRVGFRTTDTGEIKEDPYAAYNLQHAAEAGIQLGAYFFSTAVKEEEAREEARWTVDFLAGYPITYPVAYNCEGFLSTDSRMYGTDMTQRTNHALAFLEEVEKAGYEAIFHASKADLTDSVSWDTARIEAEYPVWVAQYPAVPYPQTARSTYYGEHTMWQYTSQGTVPGIHAHVDINVAYFSYEHTALPKDPDAAGEVGDVPIDTSFREVDELVTAKETTNLRTEPSSVAAETVVAQLQRGEWVRRTGVSTKGWSRLEYKGQILYAVTSLLLTEEEYQQEEDDKKNQPEGTGENSEGTGGQTDETAPAVTYDTVNDRVTAKVETNLRNAAGTGGTQVIATIRNGEWVTRTGIGSNGWSRLEYNGQTVYALTSYLTTDEDYDPSDVEDRDIVWTEVSDTMTAKDTTNLRDKPTTDGSQVIATIRHGEVVKRIAIGSNGWSRVVYNGQTLYAVTSFLTEAQ